MPIPVPASSARGLASLIDGTKSSNAPKKSAHMMPPASLSNDRMPFPIGPVGAFGDAAVHVLHRVARRVDEQEGKHRMDQAGDSAADQPQPRLPRMGEMLAIAFADLVRMVGRSEEHPSELQSLLRISSAVFCLKNKKRDKQQKQTSE